ncbi:N-methyl-L-tryptophan oxidase [Neomegalonema perideroedes]|uniref:N-methyl-L-tryptophan oxidase n=1 Tax=Neomegalonema perideroedes TaxID=217219 RepID=UPI000370045B|nr:N-methyl-L-tryptophan oxidase [Neomegalonema perideroedes]
MGAQRQEVVVLGLGAMGAATLHQLARRGVKALGIDRRRPPHVFGSTHGESRITRRAIGEGLAYVPLALRSHEIWREIEAETGAKLLHEVGCLTISRAEDEVDRPGRRGFIRRARAAAEAFGLDHEILSADDIRRRFPQFAPQDDEIGLYEPGAGYVDPEACVAAQLKLAQAAGAEIRTDLRVTGLEREAEGLLLRTDQGEIRARRLILSAGAGAGELLGAPYDRLLKPTRQMMHWFAPDPEWESRWAAGPSFIWLYGSDPEDFFYGFPARGGAVKAADEHYGAAVDPDQVDRETPESASLAMFDRRLAPRLRGIGRRRVKAATCLYTAAPDSRFLIDRSPENPDLLILSPCSGHGFKHSAAIGEAAAELIAEGASRLDLSEFSAAHLLAKAEEGPASL